MNQSNNHVVVMAGGVGSRFWPMSTTDFPKQFIDVLGCGKTLLQLTVDRFREVCEPGNMWIVMHRIRELEDKGEKSQSQYCGYSE